MANRDQWANLIQLLAAQGQNSQQGPETANIGGSNILVNREQNPIQRAMPALTNLTQGYNVRRQVDGRSQFMQNVQQISTDQQKTAEQKINDLVGLTAQHGTDYGFGVEEIVKNYGKLAQTQAQSNNPLAQARTGYYNAQAGRVQNQPMSPSLQKAKDDRISQLISMSEEHPAKIQRLDDAANFLKTLPRLQQGRSGAINIKVMMETDPANPLLGQWQNLKSILTEAQLDYVGNTKGAVSDREMALFGQAIANDDLISVARMMPQINKIKNGLLARKNAAVKTFQKLHPDEDLSTFANFGTGGGSGGANADREAAMEELRRRGLMN